MSYMTLPVKDGGSMNAYIAMPKITPAPAVIVIQEIFGVNEGIRKKCDWLAEKGFVAVAPDLFWRIEPGIELTDQTDQEWERAFELFNTFNVDQGVEDLRDAHHTLIGHADTTGQVGCLEYCLGGQLAYLLACRSNIKASIGYHGVNIENLTDEAQKITHPLMLHIAGQDEYVPKDAQDKIHHALDGHHNIVIYDYPQMDHAFTRIGGAHYNKEQADIADTRSLDFLTTHLGLKTKE